MKDLVKRQRIMQRSIKLGHCICNAKKPCPCDLLIEKDVCLCAGEEQTAPTGPVRLTKLVENAGCASKIDQASLKRILSGLPEVHDPRVLVGVAAGDDAGVYQLNERLALVQTVDVFCPSLDDPYLFGQVAAANSLSDIYAMGARPITALSIIGFPVRSVPDQAMFDILRGGLDKMREAGVAVIGGHSIKDPEIKAGFAVTGLIDPQRVATNAAARPGDVLVLTKPLGTGIIAFASQINRAGRESTAAAARWMTELNKVGSELMMEFGAHAATDVTGFGLLGHLGEMAASSGVDVEIVWDDLPLLPGVLDCLGAGIVPGGVERNRESSAHRAELAAGVEAAMLDLCLDPQTSGGLLIALPAGSAPAMVERMRAAGLSEAAIIGRVTGAGGGRVTITTRGGRPIPAEPAAKAATPVVAENLAMAEQDDIDEPDNVADGNCCSDGEAVYCSGGSASGCCSDGEAGRAAAATTGETTGELRQQFQAFLKDATGRPGALDAATKEAVALALAIVTRCGPCTTTHLKKARSMGFSESEIEELAMIATAFGGSPVMMFYDEIRRRS